MIDPSRDREALAWQTGVWDGISDIYVREIDRRFAPVVESLVRRARLLEGEHVLDLGTGTGAVARRAAAFVGPRGRVVGVDISPEMLAVARRGAASVGPGVLTVRLGRAEAIPAGDAAFDAVLACLSMMYVIDRGAASVGPGILTLLEGRAEAIPAGDAAFDAVLACLSMMYVIDRGAAAREIARVLKPGGRFVAAVWAGPDRCDIVQFQQTAGRFAGPPPVPGVGPGALAEPDDFLRQLGVAGIEARVETETLGFDFPDFASAWNTLAGVTTAQLPPGRQQEARDAVMLAMYPEGDGPRHFRNETQFIIGRAREGSPVDEHPPLTPAR